MAKPELDPMRVAKTIAIFCGVWTILLWVLSGLGFYTGMALMMKEVHLFFAPGWDVLGLVLGTAEMVFYGFFGGYAFVWLYNKL